MNALIDRYIHQVREHLPAPLRDDIARELESLILDTLDDRARQRGLTDDLIVEVLSEFGEPSRVAARYQASPPPIESEWVPLFWRYLRLLTLAVALGLAGLWILMLMLAFAAQPVGWRALVAPRQAAQWLGSYAVTLILNLGLLVAFFALFGRWMIKPSEPSRFDPRELPPVRTPKAGDDVWRGWGVIGALLSACVLIVMNVRPEWFGVLGSTSGAQGFRWHITPFSEIGLHLPREILSVWWSLALVLAVVLLVRGRWSRILERSTVCLALACAGILFYVALVSDPSSAAPGLDVIGRLAVAIIAVNGVVLLGCSGYWLWTIVQPSKPIVLARSV